MKFISKVIYSTRPNTWPRVWGEMIVAASLASYPHLNLTRFILGFIATSPLLWGAAYMFNDMTDINLDKEHAVRKVRPIGSGQISHSASVLIILTLYVSALVLSFTINVSFFLLIIILSVSQILYTLKPFRLKERPFFDVAVNGVNSSIRFMLGWFSQIISHPFVIYPLLFFVAVKLILFIGHRLQNKTLEERFHIRSTVTVFSKSQLYLAITVLAIIALFCYFYSIILGVFPLISFPVCLAASLPLFIYIKVKLGPKIFTQEENLSFRNLIYVEYFFVTNIIAITILIK